MKASAHPRLQKLERWTYENLIPLRVVVNFFEESLTFFRTREQTVKGAREVALLFEYFVTPLRTGDMAEFWRRGAEWQTLDDEQRLQLLEAMESAR